MFPYLQLSLHTCGNLAAHFILDVNVVSEWLLKWKLSFFFFFNNLFKFFRQFKLRPWNWRSTTPHWVDCLRACSNESATFTTFPSKLTPTIRSSTRFPTRTQLIIPTWQTEFFSQNWAFISRLCRATATSVGLSFGRGRSGSISVPSSSGPTKLQSRVKSTLKATATTFTRMMTSGRRGARTKTANRCWKSWSLNWNVDGAQHLNKKLTSSSCSSTPSHWSVCFCDLCATCLRNIQHFTTILKNCTPAVTEWIKVYQTTNFYLLNRLCLNTINLEFMVESSTSLIRLLIFLYKVWWY